MCRLPSPERATYTQPISPSIETATCSIASATTTSATYTITITAYPLNPTQNNLIRHDGNPPITMFQCDNADVTSSNTPTCVVAEAVPATTEYEVCSRRGMCDFTTGICTCFTGFSGSGCHQDNIVTSYADNAAINLVEATGAACEYRVQER